MYQRATNEPVILFASRPCFDEFCAMTIYISNPGDFEMTSQPHVIRCRELLFTEPEIISTPSLDFDQCFYVIMHHKLYKTGRLQTRFEKKGLKASSPYRVLPALYQACLRYTLTAKIAPSWNKVGEWHLQGRDFVTHNGYMNGIKMNLVVNSDEVYMSVFGTSVKCPHLQIHDLDIDTTRLSRMFEGDRRFQTLELNQWCYILPSMKKGRIVSVSRQIPQYDCPFTTYKDLKKHWKNTYGYRLPETDEEILFYQVTFLPLGGRLFTYPSVCLCSRNLQTMPRIDPKPIITAFLQDIHNKIPSICGQSFQFQPKIRYTQQEFLISSEIKDQPKEKLNLVSRNPKPPTIPLRNLNQVQHMYQSKIINNISRITQSNIDCQSTPSSNQNEDIFLSQSRNQMSFDNHGSTGTSENINFKKKGTVNIPNTGRIKSVDKISSNVVPVTSHVDASQEQNRSSRIIPLFRPKSKSAGRQVYKPEGPKQVPSFSSRIKHTIPVIPQKTFSLESVSPVKLVSNLSQPKTLPVFSSQKTKPAFTHKPVSSVQKPSANITPKLCPNFSQKKIKQLSTSLSKSTQKLKTQNRSSANKEPAIKAPETPKPKTSATKTCSPGSVPRGLVVQSTPTERRFVPFGANPKALSTPKPRLLNPSIPHSKTPVFSITDSDTVDTSFDVFNNLGSNNPIVPVTPKATTNLSNNFSTPKPGQQVGNQMSENWMLKTPDKKAKKRKETVTPSLSQGEGEGGEAKKPRAKPKIQVVDVEKLARSNQMGKANALTLTTWLKQRNIVVKAKDKKNDLVDKVFSFLNLAKPTELTSPSTKLTPKLVPSTPHNAEFDDSSSSVFQIAQTEHTQKPTEFSHSLFNTLQNPEP
ncbi:hypothetical protein LOTGIDRAFT_234835 [Lottia gigantea]|uniref:DUF4708 domain-containing protein n=1 Tax=Lottia gigantea TaxID=225164 RepID=V3ZYU3_LOTGI|nr:hypothetical protein LOTGIDRAFT_234835 [Lottia gigantea]ESO87810.1 hypothetical protein LOTGIDRAFT_234835 [Lottia gigantea]